MKTLKRYEQICMNYFNGNISDFKKDLKGLTKKELFVLSYQLACRLGNVPKDEQDRANNIIYSHL